MDGKAHVRKRLILPGEVLAARTRSRGHRIDVRDEAGRRALRRAGRAKTVDVSPSKDGMSTVTLRGGVSYGVKRSKPVIEGTIELTHKVFNFQEDQDLRLRVGVRFGEAGTVRTYSRKQLEFQD